MAFEVLLMPSVSPFAVPYTLSMLATGAWQPWTASCKRWRLSIRSAMLISWGHPYSTKPGAAYHIYRLWHNSREAHQLYRRLCGVCTSGLYSF